MDQFKASMLETLSHAMQTGIKMEMEWAISHGQRHPSTEPKHLRVGINRGLCDHGALVQVLISKGIFTLDEYMDAMIEMLQREVKTYEDSVSQKVGKPVHLL